MAQKKITNLQLISSVTDDLNIPGDTGIQSFRATALQFKNYILAASSVDTTQLVNASVTTGKLDDLAVTTEKLADTSVTLAKLAAAVAEALVPKATVLPYVGDSAPTGYLLCDGSLVSRTTYSALYAIVGNRHGSGDGSTTFRVPDYRGRFHRGRDGGQNTDPDRTSRIAMNTGGATGDNVGSIQADAFEQHTHTISCAATAGGANRPVSAGAAASLTVTSSTSGGSTETRPVNAYVNYIIKY